MIAPGDLEYCREAIRHGSLSFHAASRLLPARVRDPALALYAFCRLADDAVDLGEDKAAAVLRLRDRLDKAYHGRPEDRPPDRAFAALIEDHDMPRVLPEALLEGLAWDALERRYDDLSGLRDYSARVASAVGAMMCVLMGVRDAPSLSRACDLGVAMQLTNIARDVGEDARAGRVYLPLDWLDAAGLTPETLCADPDAALPLLRPMVAQLLREADRLYHRAETGIDGLPLGARPGIYAARNIYAAIGGAVRRNGCDSVHHRGRTGRMQKAGLLGLSVAQAALSVVTPRSAVIYAPPLPETAFLVDGARREAPQARNRGQSLIEVLMQLERHRRAGI
ncbi:15-cis-phytoene synthase [Palleronia caenipelagi]|uniref:Phytoene/squalene synthase family protein n=1 Tax=Palleronia caenipelagi TaxID=2489174 RepID=A0A547Q933_9RHOB|nr:phytoene/squalene synthase family protein [Palleronia caenipelagi]TRD22882.1 phytoene/squalene synthase family protein [Palleronia caenipelagi]